MEKEGFRSEEGPKRPALLAVNAAREKEGFRLEEAAK